MIINDEIREPYTQYTLRKIRMKFLIRYTANVRRSIQIATARLMEIKIRLEF